MSRSGKNSDNDFIDSANSGPSKYSSMPPKVYLTDLESDGNFSPVELTEEQKPKPVQGETQWSMDILKSLRYTASARENGIEGTVIINAGFNEYGTLKNAIIIKGLSPDCDTAAIKALRLATQRGFEPLIVNEIPVKFQVEFPLRFFLD